MYHYLQTSTISASFNTSSLFPLRLFHCTFTELNLSTRLVFANEKLFSMNLTEDWLNKNMYILYFPQTDWWNQLLQCLSLDLFTGEYTFAWQPLLTREERDYLKRTMCVTLCCVALWVWSGGCPSPQPAENAFKGWIQFQWYWLCLFQCEIRDRRHESKWKGKRGKDFHYLWGKVKKNLM